MKGYYSAIKILLVLICMLIISVNDLSAHDRNTDPEYAELNDYLMAIQTLRHSNQKAELLFQRWQELRENSWIIRELTDDQDLPIDDPKVINQIEHTNKIRKTLLNDCRKYFSDQMNVMPSVQVSYNGEFTINWDNPLTRVPIGSRQIVLVEFTSTLPGHTHLNLKSSKNEEILFWSKSVVVSPEYRRYTFIYLAPHQPVKSEVVITVEEIDKQTASFNVLAEGTLPARYDWYNHKPADLMYNINHHSEAKFNSSDMTEAPETPFINFKIRHPETGDPMPVRVEVQDDYGNRYWSPLYGASVSVDRENVGWNTPIWTFQQGPFFYIGGDANMGVDPQGKTAHINHGFEFRPMIIDVPENGIVDVVPQRWINMPERGWYSGHTHIHTTDVGLPVQYSRFWDLVTKGEDLGISAILTLQGEREDHAIYSDEYPMGLLESHSTPDHLITYGEEFRNNPYGHLALLGLERLILPIGTGSLGEMGGPDFPPNQFILEEAVSQGGTTIAAHFGHYITENEPIFASWPSTGFEMPVNAALGKLHLAEIYGNSGPIETWYKILNSGFNIPGTAGPDWVMKDTPRTYVYLGDDPLTVDNWIDGLQKGRSFVTKGPMLFFTVDGQMSGSEIVVSEGSVELHVAAVALNPNGTQNVEIIVNGEVVVSGSEIDQRITIEDSAWIAARTQGAHSNPVFISFEGRERGFAEEAGEFIETINRLEEWVHTKALFENPTQKEMVLNTLNKGRLVYQRTAERARNLGRISPYMMD